MPIYRVGLEATIYLEYEVETDNENKAEMEALELARGELHRSQDIVTLKIDVVEELMEDD